jgi:hypothetical protein
MRKDFETQGGSGGSIIIVSSGYQVNTILLPLTINALFYLMPNQLNPDELRQTAAFHRALLAAPTDCPVPGDPTPNEESQQKLLKHN